MKVKGYKNYQFESSSIRTAEYIEFEKQAKKEIKAQLKPYGINLHEFCPNHFEFTCVLERNGKYVYVRVGDVRWFNWYDDVLIRTMEHEKDWHGGRNQYCCFEKIGETADRIFEREF